MSGGITMRSSAQRGRGAALATALTAILVAGALLAGCTREGSPQAEPTKRQPNGTISVPPGSPPPLPVAATAAPAEGQQVKVEINDVRADSRGLAVLRFTITNEGPQPFDVQNLTDEERDPAVGFEHFTCRKAPSGVTLVDPEAKERYHPVLRFDGDNRYCVNTRFSFPKVNPVERGRRLTLYTAYVLPSEVRSVTVEVPGFEPVEDVQVTRG
ncbi:MAG: hypothetical protein GEV03_11065 [Streptosporangiales bacterium]|nr:hypothetical protein [Streptosporangiales bacterium]